MQWLALDFENVLTLAVLPVRGPDPPKSGNEVQFQNSREKKFSFSHSVRLFPGKGLFPISSLPAPVPVY